MPTSTTASSSSLPFPRADARGVGIIACGALATHLARVGDERGWEVTVYPLNPLLHNAPRSIAREVEAMAHRVAAAHRAVVVGYADCGTYGALDDVCARLGIVRLPGLHCYDLYAGVSLVETLLEAAPGTYFLTDFLVKSFERTVIRELGLDRYPELRDDYFGHYTRALWLAQTTDPREFADLRVLAEQASARLGLPLSIRRTGLAGLGDTLAAALSF